MDVKATMTSEQGWSRTFQVTVPTADIEAAFAQVTEEYRKKAKFPGFRPGKATTAMVAGRYGDEIRQEVLEDIVPKAYDQALHQLKISALGSPKLDKVKLERGSDMTFSVEVEIRPQVEIVGYKGLKLQKQVYEITDKDVDPAVDELREMAATTTEVTRSAQEGDVVICDLQKIHDRRNRVKKSKFENVRFDLRPERTRPEFFKGLVGMGIGEGKEIEVTYPDEEPDPDLAGNTVLFRVWLKSVSEKHLPAADDEFAKRLGTFETMALLRERIAADLKRRAESAAIKDMGYQARRQVLEANVFEVPRAFLNEYITGITRQLQTADSAMSGESVRTRFEPLAIEQFRWDYTVYEIAQKEGLTVEDAEVTEVLNTWPKDSKERPSEEKIRDSLLEDKVYSFLLNNAEIMEVSHPSNSKIIKPGQA